MNTPNEPTTAPTTASSNAPSFASFDFPEALRHTLLHMNYESPTAIQSKSIPLVAAGRDILASAQTGSGKTGAFAIPLVAKLLNSCDGAVLVLTPTRELATQVLSIFQQLIGKRSKINTALLIGGAPIVKQFRDLKASPRIIVGTPGRVNDHLIRGTIKLHEIKSLVLDETDRMLDMGFDEQIAEIIRHLPADRQTLMFSATIANRIATLSKQYLNNPERVECGGTNKAAPKIKQENIHISEKGKYSALIKELETREGSIIIFVKTKMDADRLAERLREDEHKADAIHGDLQQRRRERVISDFRQKRYRIMVATDVASRGLDIPHIEHVINFNLPHCPEDYIHRIGRTARAGAEGAALNLISPEDDKKWKAINRLLNPGAHPERDRDNSSSRSNFSRRRSGGGQGGYQQGGSRAFQGFSRNDRNGGGRGRTSEGGYGASRGQSSEGGYGGRGRSEGGYNSGRGRPEGGYRSGGGRSEGGYSSGGGRSEGGYRSGGARSEGGYRAGGARSEGGYSSGGRSSGYGSNSGRPSGAPKAGAHTPSVSYADKRKKYGTSNGASNTKRSAPGGKPGFFSSAKNAPFRAPKNSRRDA